MRDLAVSLALACLLAAAPSAWERAAAAETQSASSPSLLSGAAAYGDWTADAPGVRRLIKPSDLPPPFATAPDRNFSSIGDRPEETAPKVPPGFSIGLFARDLPTPRTIHIAPNGDIFVAQTAPGEIRIMRAADGADKPTVNEVFASGLSHPFGIAFYPAGPDPQYIYIANEGSVVRFPYRNGDMKVRGPGEIIVPSLPTGGHTTRDLAFSPDGKRLYISIGSRSNVAETMAKPTPQLIQEAQAARGLGASWGDEQWRADVVYTNPDGSGGLRSFANGIRNCAGLSVQPATGDLWCATNERDNLGDNLPPELVTAVKEGAFYGWPWYYIGGNEDPRHKGERPDLASKVTVPDVIVQPHSAPLQITFYTGTQFPTAYRGDAFVTLHGSWNRKNRTGYKVVRLIMKDGHPTGEYEDFMTGMVLDARSVWGRPVGIAVAHDGSLLVSEDGNGTIWRIVYTGGNGG